MTNFPTWDSVLLGMMAQPMGVVIVRAKRRGKGHGGWSKNNPYMEVRVIFIAVMAAVMYSFVCRKVLAHFYMLHHYFFLARNDLSSLKLTLIPSRWCLASCRFESSLPLNGRPT